MANAVWHWLFAQKLVEMRELIDTSGDFYGQTA